MPPVAAEELQDTVQMVRFIQTSDLPVRYAGLRSGSTYDIMTTFGIIHTDTIYQLRVRCWCNKQASQICAFIPWRPLQAAIYCCGFCWSVISWIWVLFGCFRRNPRLDNKPSAEDCSNVGCSPGKFFCGRNKKFGLNCQAVCDVRGRFLDISIMYPGSTSNCLSFQAMSLFHQLEQGILAPGLCLFGDNAYLNSTYMATPYAVTSSGTKDAYNFYHSQLRIRIECAFGMLKHRWAILRAYLHTEECTCAQDSCTCFGTCKTAQILYQRERSRLWCCLQYCNWWVEKQGEWRCSVGRNTPTVQRWCPQCWHYPSLIAGLFVTILMISL